MRTLLQLELIKIFSRTRTYIGFIAIAVLVGLVQLLFYSQGDAFMQMGLQALTQAGFEVTGNILNGYLICFVILFFLIIHVPLLVSFVAADVVAGEAGMGTLRLLLTRPVSRTQLITSKFLAASVYSLALLCWLALLALLGSILIFGNGDLLIMAEAKAVLHNGNDVLWRYACAFGMAALAMITVTALGVMASVLADNAIGPIVGTMSVIVLFTILSKMQFPVMEKLRWFLFTYHMEAWTKFFDNPVATHDIFLSVIILLLHIAGFLGTAVYLFNKKDILS